MPAAAAPRSFNDPSAVPHRPVGLLTVISQHFHNTRALYIAREHGIDAIAFDAADVGGPAGLINGLREQIARLFAVLDVKLLGTMPRFGGPRVAIGN